MVEVRALQPVDVPAVATLEQALFSHPWGATQFHEALQAGYECWVAEESVSGAVVGYVILSVAGGEADLQDIGVDRRWQRQGVAGRLMARGLSRCRERGAEVVYLEVRASSEGACAFYRRQGFEEVGRRRAYYPTAEGREDALLFRRELSSAR